ncbi:MAG: hypothetical protein KAI79_05100 [Bacteroidales bacterium]|nr:hypothetical protein [Bacteroidales bacterium]
MKLTKKAQNMMDILEEYFSEITFSEPIAILNYNDRMAKITPQVFNYDYGGKDSDEGPKSDEAEIEHKKLRNFLKNIDPYDVNVEIVSEVDEVGEGLEMIMDAREDECLFDNMR